MPAQGVLAVGDRFLEISPWMAMKERGHASRPARPQRKSRRATTAHGLMVGAKPASTHELQNSPISAGSTLGFLDNDLSKVKASPTTGPRRETPGQ